MLSEDLFLTWVRLTSGIDRD